MSIPDPDDERSMAERMAAGDLYRGSDPELEERSHRAFDLVAAYNLTTPRQQPLRQMLLDQLLASIGEGTVIRPPLHVDYGTNLTLGARCFANMGLVALDVATIAIGDDVQIGPNVQLLTPTHPLDPELRRAQWEAAEPIVIEDNVWLGGGAIVLAGVRIGADTVVGAGAVVTRDLPPGVLAVGSPARVVRSITGQDQAAPPR